MTIVYKIIWLFFVTHLLFRELKYDAAKTPFSIAVVVSF